MTTETPKLSLPFLLASQADKHVTVNQSLSRLDNIVHMSVVSASLATQPSTPAPDAMYVLPTGATGSSWAAMASGSIALWQDGVWSSLTPKSGWKVFIADTREVRIFANGSWSVTLASNESLNSAPRTWLQQAIFSGGAEPLVLKNSNANMGIVFQNGASRRWFLYHGSSGATFNLNRYDANGGYVGTPLSVTANGVLQTEFCNLFHSGTAPEPHTDGGIALGSSTKRFSSLFATTGIINTSDAREKTKLVKVPGSALDAALIILKEAGVFKWKDSVDKKGEQGARLHVGVTAQSVEAALKLCTLNPQNWGLFCEDDISSSDNADHDNQKRLGLRIDQVLMLAILALEREVDALKQANETRGKSKHQT